jgi:hypothetical protein
MPTIDTRQKWVLLPFLIGARRGFVSRGKQVFVAPMFGAFRILPYIFCPESCGAERRFVRRFLSSSFIRTMEGSAPKAPF